MPVTKEQASAAIMVYAIAEAIREAGPRGIPSGHLYAMLMSRLSLREHEVIIELLIRSELVKEENHLLTWIGLA